MRRFLLKKLEIVARHFEKRYYDLPRPVRLVCLYLLIWAIVLVITSPKVPRRGMVREWYYAIEEDLQKTHNPLKRFLDGE